ncbi:unnamed protein product, partial [Polarella glacialis]
SLGLVGLFALQGANSLSPCDSEAGQVCPSSEGKEVGICLGDPSKHQITDIDGNPREREAGEKPMELGSGCLAFIKVNEVCDAEITEHCQGLFFHGDTMTCLTTWTKPESLGEACKAVLPKQASDDDEVEDADKAEWRAKRKASRASAMKALEEEKARNEKKDTKKKKKKAKKSDDDL